MFYMVLYSQDMESNKSGTFFGDSVYGIEFREHKDAIYSQHSEV